MMIMYNVHVEMMTILGWMVLPHKEVIVLHLYQPACNDIINRVNTKNKNVSTTNNIFQIETKSICKGILTSLSINVIWKTVKCMSFLSRKSKMICKLPGKYSITHVLYNGNVKSFTKDLCLFYHANECKHEKRPYLVSEHYFSYF